MSRRDTIIIAVLVNAALLMILFATAMRSGNKEESAKPSVTADLADATPINPAPLQDELLNEFVTSVPTLSEGSEFFPAEEGAVVLAPQSLPPATPIEITPMVAPAPVVIAPAPVEVAPKPEAQFVNVTVKKGDFLEKIAKANNTSVSAIMKANNLASTNLKIGQVLKVPLTKGGKKADAQTITSTSGEYYIVKEGDNPWLIASRNKINLEELLRLNGLDEQKAKRLRPGDKLKIR